MICHVKSYPPLASLPSRTHLVLHHIVIRGIDRQKIFSSYTYCRWKEARLLRMRMSFVCSIDFLTFLPASLSSKVWRPLLMIVVEANVSKESVRRVEAAFEDWISRLPGAGSGFNPRVNLPGGFGRGLAMEGNGWEKSVLWLWPESSWYTCGVTWNMGWSLRVFAWEPWYNE